MTLYNGQKVSENIIYEQPDFFLCWFCAINRYEFDRHPPLEKLNNCDRYIDLNQQTQQQN